MMVKPGTCILGCAVDPKDVHNLQDYITPRLVWFSYRIKFPPIEPTLKTSDVGWGCTIRSAQMFMANCLLIHELGRDQLFSSPLPCGFTSTKFKIIQLFNDNQSSPFSIHMIAQLGENFNVNIGSWHGPNMVASILSTIKEIYPNKNNPLITKVMNDGVIYRDQLKEILPTVLMVCLKLGTSSFNEKYEESVRYLCRSKFFVGIIGGHPKSSFYFMGIEGNNLLYLDPHVSQEYEYNHGKFSNSEEMRLLETYTPEKFKSTRIKSIDPSLTIGFYWNSRDEMEELLDYIDQAPTLEFGCSVIPVKASTPEYTEDNNIIEDFEMDDFL